MRAKIVADKGVGPWFVQSWYEGGEHRLDFSRGEDPFRCVAVCRSKADQCQMPVTPGRAVCRFHGGMYIRGSSPVVCQVGPDIRAALVHRNRLNPERELMDIEEAIEQLGLDGVAPEVVWGVRS